MKTIYALDIETGCALGCIKSCDHALIPHTSTITRIGAYNPSEPFHSFDNVFSFKEWLHHAMEKRNGDVELVGHNLGFDIKHLTHHGCPISRWFGGDTQLMGSASLDKVTESYLRDYRSERHRLNRLHRDERKLKNKALRKQKLPIDKSPIPSFREAKPLSLKVMAPFYLGVPPFWEKPGDYSDKEYNRLDCEYTYRLWECLSQKLEAQGLLKFYNERLMPWARMLLEAEMRGICIDIALLLSRQEENDLEVERLKIQLDEVWAPAYETYGKKINLNSPVQLTWLLRDHFGLDIKDFDGEETTGRDVLQRLAATGRRDIELFLKYRENKKLATSFFCTYRDLQHQGVLHPHFNLSGTRTGRLSANNPNLQQVPGHLKTLFVPRPGYRLITRDLSTIEPRVLAYYTEDPELCRIFIEDRDFHSANVTKMFGPIGEEKEIKKKFPFERDLAKTGGLAIVYGARHNRVKTIALKEGVQWTDAHCRKLVRSFLDAYPIANQFKNRLDAQARAGEKIINLFGRAHRYDDPEDVYMKALNTLCQSSASDLMLEASRRADDEFKAKKIDCHPLLWVHDESVWEAPEERVHECEEVIERHLTSFKLSTPYGDIPLKCEGKSEMFWAK